MSPTMVSKRETEDLPKDRPWLYAELHQKKELDEIVKTIFRFSALPHVDDTSVSDVLDSTSRGLMGYLFVHVHQAERFLKLHKRKAVPPGLAAWDLAEEAIHELLVGYLLARIGAVPQGVPHMRRALELVVEGVFLSTSYLDAPDEVWSPFSVLYLSDMWQLHAARRPLRAREVIESIRHENRDVTKTLKGFSEFYVKRFVPEYCGQHFMAHETDLKSQGFPSLLSESLHPGKQTMCVYPGCKSVATKRVLERVPDFDLMREVVKAKLGESGYSSSDDNLLKDIYARSSGFVHVTREAHKHRPGWEEAVVNRWAELMHDVLAWIGKALASLWQYHQADLPGIRTLLEKWRFDFTSQRWSDNAVKLQVCNLFLMADREKHPK